MILIAKKKHAYRGRPILPGQQYSVTSAADARLLTLAGLASEFKEMKNREIVSTVTEDLFEEPEQEERKSRRRYRRKDMVPENENT